MTRFSGSVVVVGAGASGMAAAIAAARCSADVVLLESADQVGGVVSRGLIHTIGGLYDARGKLMNDGLPAELASRLQRTSSLTTKRRMGRLWTLAVSPHVYFTATMAWLQEEPRISVFTNVSQLGFTVANGAVSNVTFESEHKQYGVSQPLAVIDCTGNGNAVGAIDETLVRGDVADVMGAVVLRLGGIDSNAVDQFARVAVRQSIERAVARQQISPACSHVWIDRGIAPDELYVKVPVAIEAGHPWPLPMSEHRECLERSVSTVSEQIAGFLTALPQFAQSRLLQVGEPCARGGGRCLGLYELTGADVKGLRKFEDPACSCAWPIEHWDPQGGVRIDYLDDDGWYEVPLRALKVVGVQNLWCAGKCLSADCEAQASARIAGCCWATGAAAGLACARTNAPAVVTSA